jgi:hypothetical protein
MLIGNNKGCITQIQTFFQTSMSGGTYLEQVAKVSFWPMHKLLKECNERSVTDYHVVNQPTFFCRGHHIG